MKRSVAVVLAAVLVIVACGGASDDLTAAPQAEDTATAVCAPGVADCGDADLGDGGAADCESGAVDCNDAVETAQSLAAGTPAAEADPNGTDPDAVIASSRVLDGAMTVPEALAANGTGVISVEGFVVATGSTVVLCELLDESVPAQCDGASITLDTPAIAELRVLDPVPYTEAAGVTWSASPVTVFGTFVDGVFVVS